MKAILLTIFIFILSLGFATNAYAIEDPLAKPNNKFGIHILFDTELNEASTLINTSGGEWGYVVIPIQSGDRDLVKWQNFMNHAKELKIIPIIRLATENYYFDTKVWRKPNEADILDFVNFLDSLQWPVKNRYIIVFNEVNRDDEWGGSANPQEYAELLSYTALLFKSRSQDYFVITSGMDNASVNGNGAINQFDFFRQMNTAVPGIFNQVDGISSHAYPNPGFASAPTDKHQLSISSFSFERTLIESMTNKKLPVFITETGWTSERIPDDKRAEYYQYAFDNIWSDPGIVTVAPFLLRAHGGPFEQFSFIHSDGSKTKQFEKIAGIKKVKGKPQIQQYVLGVTASSTVLPTKVFERNKTNKITSTKDVAMYGFQYLFNL